MKKFEFMEFFITMIAGGLIYSISSFAYMHSTFSSRDNYLEINGKFIRLEDKISSKLKRIEDKLDRVIEREIK